MTEVSRKEKRDRRKMHIRKKLSGTSNVPRVTVFKSNRYLFAQVSDDEAGRCIAGCSEKMLEVKKGEKPTERAARMGSELAKILKEKKIERIVFDRGGNKYHGRIKELADSMRKAGVKF